MDVGTGLALLGSVRIIEKMLGPTAEYFGEGLKAIAVRRVANIRRIFDFAIRKLGAQIDSSGSVPARVLGYVINEGSYCNDELTAEYFGGILASSRSGISRDDRGAHFARLVAGLSTYQVRLHYVLYRILRVKFAGPRAKIGHTAVRSAMSTFVPYKNIEKGLAIVDGEEFATILDHAAFGLADATLITNLSYGNGKDLPDWTGRLENGVCFSPTVRGVELFMWAHASGDRDVLDFLTPNFDFDPVPGVVIDLDGVTRKCEVLPDTDKSESYGGF